MKKVVAVLTIATICTAVSYKALAQKAPFAGTVKFEVKYEGDIDPQKHIPYEISSTVFENKTKQTIFIGINIYVIQDGDALIQTVLIDHPQDRIGYVDDREAVEDKLLSKKFTYAEREDTKTICGYECKGYDVTCIVYNDDEDDDEADDKTEIKWIVYTTKEIGKDNNINAFDFPRLSGFPLYMECEVDGVKTISQAKEVKPSKVKAIDFLVPSNYKMKEGNDKASIKQWLKVNHGIE